MKKTLATVLVLSLIVALSACGELATTQQPTTPTTAQTQPETPAEPVKQADQTVTKEQAVTLALQEAGVSKDTVTKVEAELDQEKNETVWEVEIETQEKEYTYSVHASNGTVEVTEVEEEQPAAPETVPATQPPAPQTQPEEKKVISRERAIEIALQEASLTKDGVTDLEAELDKERGGLYWEVSFETKTTEYDYDIHAEDGTVAKRETEKENEKPAPTEAAKPAVSKDQAIEIALQAAGLKKADVTDLEAELDKERDGLYWEVSFETKTTEYDYDIHAEDGTVVKRETEKEDEKPAPTEAVKPAVTKDQAIEIALQAAGLKKADVTDLEAELDKERDGLYWEVSFETKTTEYEYDIHAEDGTVVKRETEKEDEKPAPTEAVKPAVTKDQAIEIALQAAGLKKADVTDLEAELDKERGVPVWEVSFETRQTEYSYEINAEDGKIVKAESERND